MNNGVWKAKQVRELLKLKEWDNYISSNSLSLEWNKKYRISDIFMGTFYSIHNEKSVTTFTIHCYTSITVMLDYFDSVTYCNKCAVHVPNNLNFYPYLKKWI